MNLTQDQLIAKAKEWLQSPEGIKELSDSMGKLEIMKFELFKARQIPTEHLKEPFAPMLAKFAELLTNSDAEPVALVPEGKDLLIGLSKASAGIKNYLANGGEVPRLDLSLAWNFIDYFVNNRESASHSKAEQDAEHFFEGMVAFNPHGGKRYPINKNVIQVAVEAYNTKRSPERWDGAPWGEAGRLNHTAGIKAAIQAYLKAITKG